MKIKFQDRNIDFGTASQESIDIGYIIEIRL